MVFFFSDGPGGHGGESSSEGGEMTATMMGGEMGGEMGYGEGDGEGEGEGIGNIIMTTLIAQVDPVDSNDGHRQHHGESHETDSSEDVEFWDYVEDHPWAAYAIVIIFVGLFCFLCCLSTCMCKEAFCRGSCKYCRCNRNRRRCQQNNMQRRNAEYTELQQV